MGTAFNRMDIVDIREDSLLVAVVVLKSDVDWNNLVGCNTHRLRDQFFLTCVEIFYEFLKTFLRIEHVALVDLIACRTVISVLVNFIFVLQSTLVRQRNFDTFVKERKLTHSVCKRIVVVNRRYCEYLRIRMESDGCSGILTFSDHLNLCKRLSFRIFLQINLALSVHLGNKAV